MMIPLIDVILLITLAGFVFYGFFFGFIRSLGSLVGLIIAAIVASRLYLEFYDWIGFVFGGLDNLGKILSFIILFSVIHHVVGIAFYFVDRVFNLISIIPFVKTFNRLGGALLGSVIGSLAIGLVLYVATKYTLLDHWFGQWLAVSKLSAFFLTTAKVLMPLLPEMLKALKSLV